MDKARTASLADVARLAGVSAQTASRVVHGSSAVSEQTRERVLEAIRDLGYRPSFAGRSLRGERYLSVGVVMPDISETGNAKRFDGIASAAEEAGYAVTLVKPADGPFCQLDEVARRVTALPVDAMIFNINRTYQLDDFAAFMPPAFLRCVAISSVAHPTIPCVDADQIACAQMVVDHLVARGHRRIRFVGGPADSIAAVQREQGWRDAAHKAGIELTEPLRGDWSVKSGYDAGLRIVEEGGVTAVFAANDEMAAGVYAALHDHGLRVPDDVSLVGVDDGLSGVLPGRMFTSVRFDDEGIGRLAFSTAIDPTVVGCVTVPGTLVDRGSVTTVRA